MKTPPDQTPTDQKTAHDQEAPSPTREPSILVGFNDSDASVAALEWAGVEAQRLGARLQVLWVLPSSAAWEMAAVQVDFEKRRRQMDERARAVCREVLAGSGVRYHVEVREGSPTSLLLHEAERVHAAMLVVGATRRGRISEVMMGSVVHDLVHRAALPVVAVPAPQHPEPRPARRRNRDLHVVT